MPSSAPTSSPPDLSDAQHLSLISGCLKRISAATTRQDMTQRCHPAIAPTNAAAARGQQPILDKLPTPMSSHSLRMHFSYHKILRVISNTL